jgi:catechol 2,3-dioxygenase-like lactoylglutathione lyase family enzyme
LVSQDYLPKLHAIVTYVRDVAVTSAFLKNHLGLESLVDQSDTYLLGDITWRLLPGAEPCGTHGPHGVLPAFFVEDFGAARGYLNEWHVPIVFEEMVPGLNLLIFLDPDGNPIELMQETDAREWDIRKRKALRTRQRRDEPSAGPLKLGDLGELTIYTHEITASGRFYQDVVGLPVGLSFFGHIHLVADNLPVVLRATNWHCKAPHLLHSTEPVFRAPNVRLLSERLTAAGYPPIFSSPARVTVTDPIGLRMHFVE